MSPWIHFRLAQKFVRLVTSRPDEGAQIALAQQLHPLEFLRLLLEEELLARKDRTAKALTTKARFRFRADLEDLDLTFHKDLTKAKIKEPLRIRLPP